MVWIYSVNLKSDLYLLTYIPPILLSNDSINDFSKINRSATIIYHDNNCCLLSISCNLVDNATN
jgi:hypothetical protein